MHSMGLNSGPDKGEGSISENYTNVAQREHRMNKRENKAPQ